MRGLNITDDPEEIRSSLEDVFNGPLLLNVNTHRKFWHSGAGIDDENTFDRYEFEMSRLGKVAEKIHKNKEREVKSAWKRLLETQ